jgi:small multidrug resistance pump
MKSQPKKWVLLSGAIAAEVTGTMALRAMVDHSNWVLAVIGSYATAFVLLGIALRLGMPIGVAYGIWGASGVALVAVLGAVVFEEALSLSSIIGISVILVGVVLVEADSHQKAATAEKIK